MRFRLAPVDTSFSFPDPVFPELKVADVYDATIDFLQLLAQGAVGWEVPLISGMSEREIRQVQLIDALRSAKLVDGRRLQLAAKHRFNAKSLMKIGGLSDAGAQSPRETFLRLILRDVAPWESQVEVFSSSGRSLSTADLTLQDLLVGIFYDGEHHLRRSQRDYDSQVWAILNQMGWRVLRVTNGMLDDPQWIVAHVTQLVAEARAEQITRVSRAVNRPRMSR